MSAATACPKCGANQTTPVPAGRMATCGSCGHRWSRVSSSDEYLPVEGDANGKPGALTDRHTPSRPVPTLPADGSLPFDQLERESSRLVAQRPVSELAFRPSTDSISEGRTSCPVCGHGFVGKPDSDDQRCPQCATAFSCSTGRLTPGGPAGGDRLIGRVLRGCMIDRKLGEGGMGAVYHARQLSLDRSVAIKVLPPELARNRNFIQRFEREAKSLARINHANILQIYDFGDDPALGVYFMVIEFVDGWDIGELLRRQPTLSQIETLDILRQALLGLEQAADKGVIHRDIKPDNLMVGLNGLCKVSDFGLAKGHAGDAEVTSVGVRVGTPAFMSPEQCDGIEVDSRSDVYNLGCTAFLMMTGQLPFDGETPFSIMLKHKVDPVPGLRSVRANIDPEVEGLIRRMMAKRPDDRCYELRELIDEAERLLIKLTGTASVLRKTNGPIRALVRQASGQGSSGKRAAEAAAGSREQPLAGARPSGRQRSQPPPPPSAPPATGQAIPDWLRPVDVPTPAAPVVEAPFSTPAPAPASGSRTAQVAAIGSGTAQAAAVGSRVAPAPRPSATGSRLLPAQPPPTLVTPFPGDVTPLPGDRRSGSSSVLAPGTLDRLRDRGIKAEVAAIAAGAERMASSGSLEQAASEWKRASQLARDSGESRRLADLARHAAARARRRRRLRGLAIGAFSAVLLGVNLWIWPPVVHNLLAERERARIEAGTDAVQRARALRDFAAANQGGWRWYRMIFGRGYDVPAAAAAAQSAATPPTTAAPPAQPAPRKAGSAPVAPAAVADFQRLAADPAVPLQQVLERGRALGADPAVVAVCADVERQLVAARDLRQRSQAALAQGRHGEALDLAARLAAEAPRAGSLLADLPLPGRVRAVDADSGQPVADVRLVVGGGEVAPGDSRFARSRSAEVVVEAVAPGYAAQRVTVPADAAPAERTVEIRLAPAPVWRVVAPAVRPAWMRLHQTGASLVAQADTGVSAIDPATGTARPLTLPGVRIASWWAPVDGGWAFATADGEQRQILPGADRAVPVRRLAGAPLAMLDVELVYRAGGRLSIAVEAAEGGLEAVARDGSREVWRLGRLAATPEPLLRRADDKIVLVDGAGVRVIEEDGTESARLPFQAPRTGASAELPGGRLLIGTAGGVELLQVSGGVRLIPHPWLADAGAAVPAADGDLVVLARPDRAVDIAQWAQDPVKPRWRAKIGGRPLHVSATGGLAAVADDAGVITVLRLADGVTVRRIAHGAPPIAAPLLGPGLLVVADQTGGIAGYRLPQ